MKRNVLLTSLIAIGLAYNANAATDVTFGGDYTMSNGNPANVADTLTGATYDYTTSSGTETGIAYNTDPDKTKFTYTNPDDTTGSLNDTVPTQDEYVGTTTASGDVVSTQSIAAGQTADRANYTYVNGAGETVVLGDEPQNMTDSVTLNAEYAAGKEINFTNGDADTEFDGSLYSFQLDNGNTFVLSADGTKLLDENGIEVSPSTGTDIETKFNAAQSAYNTDKTAFDAAKADTLAKWGDEQTKFNNAEGVFNADSALIADLDAKFASIGTAQELYDAALAKQEQAVQTQRTEEAVLKAATDVYDKPILETITNGANDAIDGALAENGAIRTELDKKVNMSDAEAIFAEKQQWVDNTLGLESANSNAVADALTGTIAGNETTFTGAINMIDNAVSQNTSDIATNATNIAANKTAIENEVARATAAEAELDGKIATNKAAIENEVANRISADDAVLANAKAYADAKGTMSLQAAKDYTDVRFNELDEELSAGVASAVAMSSVAVSNVGKGEVSVGGGYGYYNSQSAIAFGAAMGISDNWSVNAAAGLSDSNVTFRAGTNYKFKLF